MALIQSLISSDKYSLKCPYSMIPKGICIHNTANDASAANEISYMKSNSNSTSFHIAVDDIQAIKGLPFNRNAWASGDGSTGEGNRNYIHIEICYSLSGGPKFDEAERRAAKEVALLLKEYKWTTKNVKKHQDFANKDCPHRTISYGWDRFLKMIQVELNKLNTNNKNEVVKVDYIIQYSDCSSKAIAEVMADRLNCPTINCLRPYAFYSQYKTVIAVGEAKNKSGYTNVEIKGSNIKETLKKAEEYLAKLGK